MRESDKFKTETYFLFISSNNYHGVFNTYVGESKKITKPRLLCSPPPITPGNWWNFWWMLLHVFLIITQFSELCQKLCLLQKNCYWKEMWIISRHKEIFCAFFNPIHLGLCKHMYFLIIFSKMCPFKSQSQKTVSNIFTCTEWSLAPCVSRRL